MRFTIDRRTLKKTLDGLAISVASYEPRADSVLLRVNERDLNLVAHCNDNRTEITLPVADARPGVVVAPYEALRKAFGGRKKCDITVETADGKINVINGNARIVLEVTVSADDWPAVPSPKEALPKEGAVVTVSAAHLRHALQVALSASDNAQGRFHLDCVLWEGPGIWGSDGRRLALGRCPVPDDWYALLTRRYAKQILTLLPETNDPVVINVTGSRAMTTWNGVTVSGGVSARNNYPVVAQFLDVVRPNGLIVGRNALLEAIEPLLPLWSEDDVAVTLRAAEERLEISHNNGSATSVPCRGDATLEVRLDQRYVADACRALESATDMRITWGAIEKGVLFEDGNDAILIMPVVG